MIRSLAHVGIAVRDLEASAEVFRKLLGVNPGEREDVEEQGVRTVFFSLQSMSVELLAPTREDSPVAKFLAKRGEGMHHLSFDVDDIRAELDRLKKSGFELVDDLPRRGAGGNLVAFLHPRSSNGVLVELCQKSEGSFVRD